MFRPEVIKESMRTLQLSVGLAFCLLPVFGRAELSLHPLISDHAVFQRDVPFPVMGKSDPGSDVLVQWQGKEFKAKAGRDGKWMVQLEPSPANEKGQILKVVAGTNSIQVSDILVGEVWVASGQSNMEWKLKQCVAQSVEAEKAEDPLFVRCPIGGSRKSRGSSFPVGGDIPFSRPRPVRQSEDFLESEQQGFGSKLFSRWLLLWEGVAQGPESTRGCDSKCRGGNPS
ncbi:MAG: hypothetical protein EBT69_08245 [Verrucomicrobia bacterium]|nr:hypothetical protein [Verrucomicrobiota bacterium]